MTLYLVRHPQPDVAPGLCYGASDVPVQDAELARTHAALAARGLPDLPVHASPLQRCARAKDECSCSRRSASSR